MLPTSPPAQNARPAPVTITLRVSSSAPSAENVSASSWYISPDRAFSLSGRLSVTVATPFSLVMSKVMVVVMVLEAREFYLDLRGLRHYLAAAAGAKLLPRSREVAGVATPLDLAALGQAPPMIHAARSLCYSAQAVRHLADFGHAAKFQRHQRPEHGADAERRPRQPPRHRLRAQRLAARPRGPPPDHP